MNRSSTFRFDGFVVALFAVVLIASILPVRGVGATVASGLADAGIVLLFFLHGARLSRAAVIAGAAHWRLHVAVLSFTFGLFPLLGTGFAALPGIDPLIGAGMIFLGVVPSTVQSSIAFTALARGNVAAAVCSATFSNLAGMLLTPVLVSLLIGATGSAGGGTFASAGTIAFQLLLPFVAGHLLQPRIGGWIARRKQLLTLADRGSILLVVYTAFSAAVVEGLWQRLSPGELLLIVTLCSLLLAIVLIGSWHLGRMLGFAPADRIVLQLCGSKKSLAAGVPMAGVLFSAAQVGSIILPLMIFHQIQLMVCAVLARRYAERPNEA